MNREEARQKLMDYLYDELPADEKSEMERMIEDDPSLKEDLKEMEQIRKLIQLAPEEKPQSPLVFLQPDVQAPRQKNQKHGEHFAGFPSAAVTALSIAASILIILFGSSLAGLHVTSSAEGFSVGFGETAEIPEDREENLSVTDEDLVRLAEQIRTENSLLISAMMDDLQNQQRQQLQEAIQVLNTYYVQQRQEDLNVIADGMNQLQVETAYKFLQTDETIENIIYALNNQ